MKKQLTSEEVDKLFDFVRSKYVKYIDVQYEIVDHLASAIEDKQEQNPTLSFNRALEEVYSKFPITGFVHMVAAREKAMTRFWTMKLLQNIVSYFKLPKLILLSGLTYMLSLLFKYGTGRDVIILHIATLFIFFSCFCYGLMRGKKFDKSLKEKYLILNTYNSMLSILWLPVYFFPSRFLDVSWHSGSLDLGIFQIWSCAFIISFFYIIAYAIIFVMPELLKHELKEKYAHLGLM